MGYAEASTPRPGFTFIRLLCIRLSCAPNCRAPYFACLMRRHLNCVKTRTKVI